MQYCSCTKPRSLSRRPLYCTVVSAHGTYCNYKRAYAPASLLQVQCCPSNLARCMIRARVFFVCAIPCCRSVCVDVAVSALVICTVHSLTILLFTTSNRSRKFSLRIWPQNYNDIVARTREPKQGAGTGSHKLFALLVGFRVGSSVYRF